MREIPKKDVCSTIRNNCGINNPEKNGSMDRPICATIYETIFFGILDANVSEGLIYDQLD